jgi:hypothetical protein
MMLFRHGMSAVCLPLLLAACGSASVSFQQATSAPDVNDKGAADRVAAAVEAGSQVFNVPVSRITVAPKASAAPSAAATPRAAGAPTPGGAAKPASTTDAPAGGDSSGATTTVTSSSGKQYVVAITPQESALTLRATATNNFFSKNQLGVSKVANTDIPITITNQFTDQTASRIQAIGSVVATVLPLAAAAAPPVGGYVLPVCKTDDPSGFTFIAGSLSDLDVPQMLGCFTYTISKTGVHQADTITRQQFIDRYVADSQTPRRIWPVASCLDVTLTVRRAGAAQQATPILETPLRIIDPGYIRLLPLPEQGKIAMHPVCDADVSDNPIDRWQAGFDSLTAIVQQVQAVQKAAKPGGSANDASGGTKKN